MRTRGRRGRALAGIMAACFAVVVCDGSERERRAGEGRPTTSGQTVRVAADVEVSALAPGVWLHTSWYTYPGGVRVPSNGLLVREGDHLVLIDTAWGELPTEQLLDWVDIHLDAPVTRAIITHSHHDRIGGSAVLERRGVEVLAHPRTRRFAAEQGLPIPDTLPGLGTAGSVVELGSLEVFFPGPGHTRDNIMVWLPDHGILFGGCAVRSGSTRSLGNIAHADTAAWPRAIEHATRRYAAADRVVPGHGAAAGPELLAHTLSLFAR